MLDTARKLLALLERRERIQLYLLLTAVLVMAFLEIVSVAAVLPFLAVAADPARVQENAWLAWAYDGMGFTSPNRFLIALGAAALVALVLSNAWMATTAWAQARFAYGRVHSLGGRLLRHYAQQPYVFFLRRNSADLGKNVLAEVEWVTSSAIFPGLQLVARAAVTSAIVGLLVVFDPLLALTIIVVLGGAYTAIFFAVQRRLIRLGMERIVTNTGRYKAVSELFGAIKDVKLLGKEGEFLRAFDGPSSRLARQLAATAIIGQLPRYALESVAFGGVLLIAIYLLLRGDGMQQILPILGLYAFAGYRLTPSVQHVFQALTQLRFGAAAVDNLAAELASWTSAAPASPRTNGRVPESLPLCKRLELEGVTFTYPGAHRPALKEISLTIEANTTVGIMGPTGSGKTTLVDVILGLLRPDAGEIFVDGVSLTDVNLRAWQNTLGYVPQHIYLSDDTVARNIAFGVPPHRIDTGAVERAARLAQIHDFVAEELPEGYATMVGERGVRLSGGQRQRIGIARALYHDPDVLVFDEATSALDNETESALMEGIQRLAGTRTMILIAHRLTTLRTCKIVHALAGGRVARAGAYDQLVRLAAPHALAN